MTKKALRDDDNMHGLRRTGGLTWSVRLSIPRDRWADAGKAFGTKTGIKQEVIRSLGTRDKHEALRRRDKALAAMREDLDAKLVAAGFLPIHGHWQPDWMNEDRLLTEALEARREITATSDRTDGGDDQMGGTDPKRRLIEGMDYMLEDRAEQLEKAGKNPSAYVGRYREIALGKSTPIGPLFDRWMRDVETTIRQQTARGHRLAFRLLGEFLASQDGDEGPSQNPETLIASISVESVTKRRIGEFPEWLAQRKGLSAKTIQSRVSPLKTFWDWLERKGYSEANPWLGATKGLKRRAEKEEKRDREREYTEAELIALLQANPDAHRRWGYGAVLFDLVRLGLLTGARQNELASLTRERIQPPETEGALPMIVVTSEVAKTRNSRRRIPLHPLAQKIIKERLEALEDRSDDAPLFPECPPGGPDGKRSWTLSKRFTLYRVRKTPWL
ncbi:hypothetical protein BAR24_12280 [Gluconobacter oxydans]|uniref:site-specific integrase n=1 Tax=Gluconobacter thailandicus TaxID=257438 RepID=UPI00029998D7|nr:phage integrase SAM-like domain-containing protein [Gluconobacter thailandicus]AFW02316.1 hypothetical protein B932_2770 [Gluconobacter oxydans H24]ANQ42162.1 hypothetical protein BAR24_12280 [Gluconobacter oxydans]